MPISQVTALPSAPQRTDPDTFSTKADALMSALPPLVTEVNAVVVGMNDGLAQLANANIQTAAATAAANTAQATAGATAWLAATNYAKNQCAISQINFQTYRRRVAGTTATDPMNDSTNWALLVGQGSFIPVAQASATFDLSTGNYFKRTISGSETWVFNNIPQDGFSWTVEAELVAGALTLPSSVKTPGNQVYTMSTGKSHLLMFVTSNKGTRIRMVVAPNYDT